jgi:hypothetical protein
MTTAVKPLFQTFLPPGRPHAGPPGWIKTPPKPPPKAPPPKAGGKKTDKPIDYSSDPESDPAVQRARSVNDYAHRVVEKIQRDYVSQTGKWKLAFEHVVTAFASAIEQRDIALEQAKAAREREAAVGAFVLSLLTAGSMKLLSVYVEHRFIPSFTYQHRVVADLKVAPEAVRRFSDAQAAAFGGLVEEAGKELMNGLKPEPSRDFPQPPKSADYRLDTSAGLRKLDTDFATLIDDSASVVKDQFESVLGWMNHQPDFGQAWLAHTGGNLTAARAAVKARLLELREQWAQKWEFFGTTPTDFNPRQYPGRRDRLANHFERSLWASYTTRAIRSTQAERKEMEKHRNPYAWTPAYDRGPEYTWKDPYIGRSVDEKIVDRLKQLNVVMGETVKGIGSQLDQARRGEPYPGVEVKGEVDRATEETALLAWAGEYLKRAPVQSMRDFFPAGVKRALPSLDG